MEFEIKEYVKGTDGPVIIWPMYQFKGDEFTHTCEEIDKLIPQRNFTIVAIMINHWNEELSPWKNEALDPSFAGKGIATREWIIKSLLPNVREKYGLKKPIFIMGYSLAGLFALWTMCEEDQFNGALSVSGSLWYPDFVPYLYSKDIRDKKIYLSLGGKEAASKNELISSVLEKTKEAQNILRDKNDVFFELNPGGHFADSGKRLAKGVRWIIESVSFMQD